MKKLEILPGGTTGVRDPAPADDPYSLNKPPDLWRYVTPTGLELPKKLAFEVWSGLAPVLGHLGRLTPWIIGDWLSFGESRYGEKYAQAVELTGYSRDTLRNFQWIAEQYAPEDRWIEQLSIYHHQVVAKLPPGKRAEILAEAAESELTIKQTRELAREAKGPEKPPEVPKAKGALVVPYADLFRLVEDEYKPAGRITGLVAGTEAVTFELEPKGG